jgi:hypothetical protein
MDARGVALRSIIHTIQTNIYGQNLFQISLEAIDTLLGKIAFYGVPVGSKHISQHYRYAIWNT